MPENNIGGESLRERIRSRGALPPGEAAAITDGLLGALEIYHSRGKLHLALWPGCVFLSPGRLRLLPPEKEWIPQRVWYQAPEVKLGRLEEADISSDLYSACAVFFSLLMGREIREGEVLGRDLSAILRELSCRSLKYGTAAAILGKGLHTLPRKRYRTVGELREDLGKITGKSMIC